MTKHYWDHLIPREKGIRVPDKNPRRPYLSGSVLRGLSVIGYLTAEHYNGKPPKDVKRALRYIHALRVWADIRLKVGNK